MKGLVKMYDDIFDDFKLVSVEDDFRIIHKKDEYTFICDFVDNVNHISLFFSKLKGIHRLPNGSGNFIFKINGKHIRTQHSVDSIHKIKHILANLYGV